MKQYYLPGKGMIEDPVFCPKCGTLPKWRNPTDDGIECVWCGVVLYNQEPCVMPPRRGKDRTTTLRRARY